jgi:hypothetical protein
MLAVRFMAAVPENPNDRLEAIAQSDHDLEWRNRKCGWEDLCKLPSFIVAPVAVCKLRAIGLKRGQHG